MMRTLAAASLAITMGMALAPTSDATPMLPMFKTCKQAHKAGVYNIPKGDPQYKKKQDPDHNGIACEGHPKGEKGGAPAPAGEPAPGAPAPAAAPAPAEAPIPAAAPA